MEEKKTISLVLKSTMYKLIIPARVEEKIRFICNKVWNVEWSGTLFYTYTGSFEDNNLTITAKDIYVMDIGSQAYTEFDMSPDVIGYMTEHRELLDCQMGLIHSHNNMSTFFSGTDINTLKDEGKDRNHFVSLIVNNAGSYTAAITRKMHSIRVINECFSYNTFEEEKREGCTNVTEEGDYIEYFKLDITKENSEFNELNDKLEEIRKSKAKTKDITTSKTVSNNNYNGYGNDFDLNYYKERYFPSFPNENKMAQQQIPFEDLDETKMPSVEEDELNFHFSEDIIKSNALQIVTGSVVIPNSSNIQIDKWIVSMPEVYTKRFGSDNHGLETFKIWVSTMIEFIIMNTVDDDVNPMISDEIQWSSLAMDLMDYFSQLPKNKYMDIINNELSNYIV